MEQRSDTTLIIQIALSSLEMHHLRFELLIRCSRVALSDWLASQPSNFLSTSNLKPGNEGTNRKSFLNSRTLRCGDLNRADSSLLDLNSGAGWKGQMRASRAGQEQMIRGAFLTGNNRIHASVTVWRLENQKRIQNRNLSLRRRCCFVAPPLHPSTVILFRVLAKRKQKILSDKQEVKHQISAQM